MSYCSELISLKHYLPLTFILYFTCSSLIKAKPVSSAQKNNNNKTKTTNKTPNKTEVGSVQPDGVFIGTELWVLIRYRQAQIGLRVHVRPTCWQAYYKECRVYLPDTDFPVLLMHSCLTWLQWVWSERLWLLAAQKQKINEFYCCRLLKVSGQYRKCSMCVGVSNMVFTLG